MDILMLPDLIHDLFNAVFNTIVRVMWHRYECYDDPLNITPIKVKMTS